ncbi:glycosyl hydrolase family 28-related protein [Paenibacillus mesophilus]|uniref:glycosyl hydrolase family 28-related protein n=1 Tax=Paenibacillus mesophilus TaxID=2582849 RepID=UPI00130539C4|nr:glycosyl hydrolase family 28-related protein [Paenibacillus mesophilus]
MPANDTNKTVGQTEEPLLETGGSNGTMSRRAALASIGMAGAALAVAGLVTGIATDTAYGAGDSCIATTLAGIRAETAPSAGNVYVATDLGQEGAFRCDPADTTSADNTGTILVTASGARFKRIIDGQWNVKWFGAKGDGITDDSTAIQNTVEAALRSTAGINSSYLGVHPRIFFPRGVYRITSNNLFSGITYTGSIKRGITYAGENMYSSVLLLETGGTEKWFYNNGPNNHKFDRIHFLDLGFTGDNDTKANGFNIWSAGGEKQFKFFRCALSSSVNAAIGLSTGGLDDLFVLQGTGNADLMKFHSCDLSCGGTVLTLNNQQSVVIEFVATDVSTTNDVVKVESGGGGCVNFFGGSCVVFTKTGEESVPRYILNVADDAAVGPGNNNYNFFGVRYELQGINRGIVRSGGFRTETAAVFDGCNFGTVVGGARNAVEVGPNNRVAFENCTLSESLKYVLKGDFASSNSSPSGGLLLFDKCQTGLSTNPLYNRITFTGNIGRAIAKDCYQRGGASFVNKKVCDFDLNKQNSMAREPSTPLKSIHVKIAAYGFPLGTSSAQDYTVEFPLGTLIKSIYVNKPAFGTSAQTYQLFVGTDDKSVKLGQSVSASGTHQEQHMIDLRDIYLLTDATNSKLRMWAEGAAGVNQTGGLAIIEYY